MDNPSRRTVNGQPGHFSVDQVNNSWNRKILYKIFVPIMFFSPQFIYSISKIFWVFITWKILQIAAHLYYIWVPFVWCLCGTKRDTRETPQYLSQMKSDLHENFSDYDRWSWEYIKIVRGCVRARTVRVNVHTTYSRDSSTQCGRIFTKIGTITVKESRMHQKIWALLPTRARSGQKREES